MSLVNLYIADVIRGHYGCICFVLCQVQGFGFQLCTSLGLAILI
ncbi:unnamed protein product [Musa acuminata subsp. malaccensis]|uniref:(wild Malaysian banana) hypothetical protein n=1 Tax=Musa acuminata subsp. malaccensis TaxID=214687 RepID=A0A804KR34_MUSAM|nr:unnamed protein product [Musa acuminata subsp. malaccensis]